MKLLMRPEFDIAGGGESRDDKYPLILVIPGIVAVSGALWWVIIWAIIQIWS